MKDKQILGDKILSAICSAYRLNNFIRQFQISGGLLHSLWKVETEAGYFVIKKLNPSIINKPGRQQRYFITDQIARLYQEKLSVIPALIHNGSPLFHFDNETFMVFPYVNGKPIKQNKISRHHVKQIGQALSRIHQENLQILSAPTPDLFSFDFNIWQTNLNVLLQKMPVIGNQLKRIFPLIISASENYQSFSPFLLTNLVISHRDLDPKNVLWDSNGHHYIIDWESSGLINKTKDLVATAIYWSINEKFIINKDYFTEFLKFYFSNKTNLNSNNEIYAGIYGLIGDWLEWLNFNIRRILEYEIGHEEFLIGVKEAKKTMRALPIIYHQFKSIPLDLMI